MDHADRTAESRLRSRSPSPLRIDNDPENAELLEKPHGFALRAREKRSKCTGANIWWLSNIFMALTIIILLVPRFHGSQVNHESVGLAGDVNQIWPQLPTETRIFVPDNRYVGNLTSPDFKAQTHDMWLGLVPKGLGFIEVADYAQHSALATPYIKYGKPVYTTSATHQLHCLYMIMVGMNELALNKGRFVMNMESGGEHDEGLTREGEDPAEHLSHCFDYLRQVIMCHGDTALEGLQTTFGPDVGGSDGWNTQHVCRKWEDVYGWLEERRIDDRVWI